MNKIFNIFLLVLLILILAVLMIIPVYIENIVHLLLYSILFSTSIPGFALALGTILRKIFK